MIPASAGDIAAMDGLRWTMVAIEVVLILGTAAWLLRRARRRAARTSEGRPLPEPRPSAFPTLAEANRAAARRNATPRGGTARVATPTAAPAFQALPGDHPRAGPQVGVANVASRDAGAEVRYEAHDAMPAVQNDALHCPRCGAVVRAHLADTPLVARCIGCGRRVAARVDGARLVVTVEGEG
jgi:hypothetical protein